MQDLARSRSWLLGLAVVLLASAACGRKGPPLPPLVRIPAGIEDVAVRRLGQEIYVGFTIPTQNVDASTPAALSRVDVFALTAPAAPSRSDFLRRASRIATIPVRSVADEEGAAESDAGRRAVSQGDSVTVRDVLEPVTGAADAGAGAASASSNRYYLALGVNDRERSSPSGRIVSVPAGAAPVSPQALTVTHTEETIRLAWDPAGGAASYLVYRDAPLPPGAPEDAGAPAPPPPQPLHDMPREDRAYTEPLGAFGQERCYRVRTVLMSDGARVESAPSEPACITPVDRFPPAAPTDLVAVVVPGGITLSWTPNREPDLAGYLVLRGTPADVTLLPVTSMPVVEAQYLDQDVVPGTRYVYAVRAVDSREPPNVSEESARDAATAR